MPPPDNALATSESSKRSILLIAGVIAAGFGLTLYVFYPGVMTYDARYIHDDIAKGIYGDWQSPVMTWLWGLIDPIAPGPASMFLLIATLYWLAFGLLALTILRKSSVWPAALLLLLAMSPPAFAFVGIIWRDVLFACAWLLASAVAFGVAQRKIRFRSVVLAAALATLLFGVLLRPNALLAAPILGAYILWPQQFLLRRTLYVYAPIGVTFFVLLQATYYGVFHAIPQHPLQTFMVFDLGGISHFANENQFPGNFTPQQINLITTGCYRPTEWDIYWIEEPCLFVMQRLESVKIFGSPTIVHAWVHAIASHPLAYLEHRSAFMWNFLARPNLTIWTVDVDDSQKMALANRAGFGVLRSIDAALKASPLTRAGTWLLACIAICAFAWRRRHTPCGAFAIGTCGSATIYLLTFFAVGVASDFRYAYWAVLASIGGGAALIAPVREGSASSGCFNGHKKAAGKLREICSATEPQRVGKEVPSDCHIDDATNQPK